MGVWGRRTVTCSGVIALALILVVLLPLWLPILLLADLVRGRLRLPLVRLVTFALLWSWLETAGLAGALGLRLVGRANRTAPNFALQRWWATNLVRSVRATTGMTIEVEGLQDLGEGPLVVLGRHVSLIDSAISAWILSGLAGLDPRYVLKRELRWDPCLDIVGHRLPNHFVDRSSIDVAAELLGIARMAEGLGTGEVAVVFPEGTRANDAKRARIVEQLRERNPVRAERLSGLVHLLPPRPAGADALLRAVRAADVATMWHVGLEGLDGFGGIVRAISRGPLRVTVVLHRYVRSLVPSEGFVEWLDERWCEMDAAVASALAEGGSTWARP